VDKVTKKITSDVVYTIPFSTHGGRATNLNITEKAVLEALKRERLDLDILRNIMSAIRDSAADIIKGKDVALTFELPIIIRRGDGRNIELHFQT